MAAKTSHVPGILIAVVGATFHNMGTFTSGSDANYGAIRQNEREGLVEDDYHLSQQTRRDPELDDHLEKDLKDLPQEVRDTVPLKDTAGIPTINRRFFMILTILIIPAAIIDTLNVFLSAPIGYSAFFIQIAAHWLGKRASQYLPSESGNQWSILDTAMVTVAAKAVSMGNLAVKALSLVELYFGVTVPVYVALPLMWCIVLMGYSYAAIAKSVVSYDPRFPWPQTLMETAVLQAQKDADLVPTRDYHSPLVVFGLSAAAIAAWQMLPGFLMPLLSSVSVLCLMAPHSQILHFWGSGIHGLGFLNFSFDYGRITSTIFLYPYWTQVVQFVAFVVAAWVLLPMARSSSLLLPNNLYTDDGRIYPVEKLITDDGRFNDAVYETLGPVRLGVERAWSLFFDYAAYLSAVTWVVIFTWPRLKQSFFEKRHFNDRLNKLHADYPEIPSWWYLALFAVSTIGLTFVGLVGYLFMPLGTLVVAVALGALIVTPLMWLYAISNFQLPLGTINDLLYGYLIENAHIKHPAGAAFFGAIAGNTWYRAQLHLELLKLGFYNHLPPRTVFLAQMYGEFLAVPSSYFTLRYVMSTKRSLLIGDTADSDSQWSVDPINAFYISAIEHVLLGPRRLFVSYPSLPYGFLFGIGAPLVMFALFKARPNSIFHFELWNTAIFFSTMSLFFKDNSVGYISRFLGGSVTMFYVYRYRHNLWRSYNYVVAGALDTGFNLFLVLLSVVTSFGISAPYWYGNDPVDPERCYKADL